MIHPGEDAADGQEPDTVTRLLHRGTEKELDRLLPLVYDTLRTLARRELAREGGAATLSTTGLVHESYLKLVRGGLPACHDRAHFFAVAARAMRQVLVERARRRRSEKRGGAWTRITLGEHHLEPRTSADDLLDLDRALRRLGKMNERLEQVVELRFFVGMTHEEIAELLGVSARTVERDWMKARLFLHREIEPDAPEPVL